MGAVSSCCSSEPADSKETIHEPSSGAGGPPRAGKGSEGNDADSFYRVSEAELDIFRKRLERSMDVVVLLADGTNLACQIKLNKTDSSFIITCDTNMRVIPLTELKGVLHGRSQLIRVETRAQLVDDPCCIALHMVSGNCIPLRFDTVQDKQAFIELAKRLRQ